VEQGGSSLAEIQEVPRNSLILLAGPPGAGKSTFCHQVVLNTLAMDRPVIFDHRAESLRGYGAVRREGHRRPQARSPKLR